MIQRFLRTLTTNGLGGRFMVSVKNNVQYLLLAAFVLVTIMANGKSVAAQEPCTPKDMISVSTDQSDYVPGSTAVISGGGFGCGALLTVTVTWPDGIAYTGDGSGTIGSDTVTTDNLGQFSYNHIINMVGDYTVAVSGQDGIVLATTAFTDAIIPPVSSGGYYIDDSLSPASIIPGTTDIGIHCDDCLTSISLPFPVSLYGTTFTTARVTSNGILTFDTGSAAFGNGNLPTNAGGIRFNTIYAFWDDLWTPNSSQGVRTAVSGSTPNRTFVVEWRTDFFPGIGDFTNFEIVFYEGQTYFDVVYGTLASARARGNSATIGVQKSFSPVQYTRYSFNTESLTSGRKLRFFINTPPTASAGGPYSRNEGSAIAISGATASDPDPADTLTYSWSVNSTLCSFDDATALNPNLTCSDNGSFTATLSVSDGVNPAVTSNAGVTVDNVAPTITSLVAGGAVGCGQNSSLTINFTDPALTNDTYRAVVDWGDGNTITYNSVTSGVMLNHAYALAGMYTVSVTVSDEDGGTSAASTSTLTLNYTMVGGGILPPINQDGSSIFKYKSTIPVKIKYADCNGTNPGTLTVRIMLTQLSGSTPGGAINEPISTSSADTTGFMRFTGSPDSQYIYNLATKPLPDPSATYRITLTVVQTGQTYSVNFGLKP